MFTWVSSLIQSPVVEQPEIADKFTIQDTEDDWLYLHAEPTTANDTAKTFSTLPGPILTITKSLRTSSQPRKLSRQERRRAMRKAAKRLRDAAHRGKSHELVELK